MVTGRWSRNRRIQGMVLDSEPWGQSLEISSTLASLASQVVLVHLTNLAFQTSHRRLSYFFPIRPSQWQTQSWEVETSVLRLSVTKGGRVGVWNSWQYWLPAGALCVQHSWPVPSPQSTCSLLFLFGNACLLTFEGVGKIGQLCWLVGKDASFERQRPGSCGAVTMWFLQHSAQHGVSKAVPVPHSSLACISNTTVKWCYPSVKLMEEQDPGWAFCHHLFPILKVCTWKFYSRLEQHHDRAHESGSLLCLVQQQHGREEGGMVAELCVGFVLLDHWKATLQPSRREGACPCSPFHKGRLGLSSSSQPWLHFLCGQEEPCSSGGLRLVVSGTRAGLWGAGDWPFCSVAGAGAGGPGAWHGVLGRGLGGRSPVAGRDSQSCGCPWSLGGAARDPSQALTQEEILFC